MPSGLGEDLVAVGSRSAVEELPDDVGVSGVLRGAPSVVSRVAAMPEPTTTATSSPVPANSAVSRRARVVVTRRA
jgi:hypothetical protein